MVFSASGTSIDRAGGLLRLRALADRLVGVNYRLELRSDVASDGHSPTTVLVVVDVDEPDGSDVIETLEEVFLARSAALRDDQHDGLEGDRLALDPILEAEVRRRTAIVEPPTVQRMAEGDR